MKKSALLLPGFILALLIAAAALPENASAFNRGNLMSDSVYLNKDSMTQAQIQNFLESKKSALSTYRDQGPNETKQELASYLIWHAAQIWNINPQVILATLQKEQSLVTMQNPESWRYRTAMGYGCPDSSKCDSLYYGFANQVNIATYQFRYNYEAILGHSSFRDSDGDIHGVGSFACRNGDKGNNPPFYNNGLLPGNVVTFARNTAISGTQNATVTIANAATASFYCYTPHAGPYATTGYSGSDNMVNFFTQWFGSPVMDYQVSFETLAGQQSGAVNKVNSQKLGEHSETISSGKNLYTFYYDTTNKTLRLSHWNGNTWSDRVIDGVGSTVSGAINEDVGHSITAVEWNGQLQVFYYSVSTKSLRHAWLHNNRWTAETLDGAATGISKRTGDFGRNAKAMIWNGQLHTFYYDGIGKDLHHSWWANGQWNFESLDGSSSSISKYDADVGAGTSMSALTWNGQIQLFYYNTSTQSLRHAWWANNRWNFESFDGVNASLGKSTNNVGKAVSVTTWNGQLQMYYYDTTTGSLKHAWWPGDGKWHFETFDGELTRDKSTTVLGNYINAGEKVVVKVIDNIIFVFYYDNATGFTDHTSAWRLAYWRGGVWNQVVLDGSSSASEAGSGAAVGGQISVTGHSNRSVQAFYQNSSGGLNHLWFPLD
ncbi:MAG: hypothetical protein ACREGE_00575 [Candidatus Microsaccharimonas sp.]